MPSSLNRRFARSMDLLETQDPITAQAIKDKLESLKSEAAAWRRKAECSPNHGETLKRAFDGEGVHQSPVSLQTIGGTEK